MKQLSNFDVQVEHLLLESKKYPDSHDVQILELEHARHA